MRNNNGEQLSIRDAEVLAEWFLHNMSMEQRHQLMAELPVIYHHLYPGVPASTIASAVAHAVSP